MAKLTSSSNRNKRKTTKPVTKGQNPQRANRQAVSTARVSQSGGGQRGSARITNASQRLVTNSAKVSGTPRAARPALPPARSPKPTPASARQPRAITNGGSATMRQLRAKAVQKQRMASGKTTVASRTPGPSAATRARISQTARSMKPIGDSARVRQATVQGQQAKASAQARRGARQAMSRMEGTLKAARTLRTIAGAAKTLGRGGVAAAVMSPTKLADGTMKGKPTGFRQGPAVPKRLTQKGMDSGSFDSAFKQSRKAGKKVFTWRGKKYTTKMKGE